MTKTYKIMICIIALIFSIGAACIRGGLVSSSTLALGMRFVYNFFFIMQVLSTIWIIIGMFRKEAHKK